MFKKFKMFYENKENELIQQITIDEFNSNHNTIDPNFNPTIIEITNILSSFFNLNKINFSSDNRIRLSGGIKSPDVLYIYMDTDYWLYIECWSDIYISDEEESVNKYFHHKIDIGMDLDGIYTYHELIDSLKNDIIIKSINNLNNPLYESAINGQVEEITREQFKSVETYEFDTLIIKEIQKQVTQYSRIDRMDESDIIMFRNILNINTYSKEEEEEEDNLEIYMNNDLMLYICYSFTYRGDYYYYYFEKDIGLGLSFNNFKQDLSTFSNKKKEVIANYYLRYKNLSNFLNESNDYFELEKITQSEYKSAYIPDVPMTSDLVEDIVDQICAYTGIYGSLDDFFIDLDNEITELDLMVDDSDETSIALHIDRDNYLFIAYSYLANYQIYTMYFRKDIGFGLHNFDKDLDYINTLKIINESNINEGEDLGYEEISFEDYYGNYKIREIMPDHVDKYSLGSIINKYSSSNSYCTKYYESIIEFEVDHYLLTFFGILDDYVILGICEIDGIDEEFETQYFKIDVGFDLDNVSALLKRLFKNYTVNRI